MWVEVQLYSFKISVLDEVVNTLVAYEVIFSSSFLTYFIYLFIYLFDDAVCSWDYLE